MKMIAAITLILAVFFAAWLLCVDKNVCGFADRFCKSQKEAGASSGREAVASAMFPECKTGVLVELPKSAQERLDGLFRSRIAEILRTPNMSIPDGAPCRYISARGSDDADGLSPRSAWRTIGRLNREDLKPGTYVLFERGGIFRGGISAKPGVTYTAYGEGPKPRITPSPSDFADSAKWEETGTKGVWRCAAGNRDVGAVVFDGGRAHGIKIVPVYRKDGSFSQQFGGKSFNRGYADLSGDLHFWHDYSDNTKFKPHAKGTGYLYLRSDENPGIRFKSIEFSVKRNCFHIGRNSGVVIDNLCIMYVGAHGVGSATVKSLKVTNCEFAWIGGSIQAEDLFGRDAPVRYGNAIEIWGGCEGYLVENCYIHDVYDAALTHQYTINGGEGFEVWMRNIRYSGNVIERCNYSVEYFISGIEDPAKNRSAMNGVSVEGNLMRDAGVGLCEQRPDKTQSAHIKSWRYGGGKFRNRASAFRIDGNVFCGGRDMLVEISSGLMNEDRTDSMPEMSGNIFVGEKDQRFGVLNQGLAVELKYDAALPSRLGLRYSGNVFSFR